MIKKTTKTIPLILFFLFLCFFLFQYKNIKIPHINNSKAQIGEHLNHNLHAPFISYMMPLASLTNAIVKYHLTDIGKQAAVSFIFLIGLIFIFGLSSFIGDSAAGFLAALTVFLALIFTQRTGFLYLHMDLENLIFAVVFLMTSISLAMDFKKPCLKNKLFVGFSIAVSILIRTSLLFLPFFILAYAFLSNCRKFIDISTNTSSSVLPSPLAGEGRRNRVRGEIGDGFICDKVSSPKKLLSYWPVFIIPAGFAFVWIMVNYLAYGNIVFIEGDRIETQLVTAALGITGTMEGDHRALAGLTTSDSVLKWAFLEILSHPLRYSLGFIKRVWFVLSQYPLLTVFSIVGIFKFLKKPETKAMLLILGYFIFTHCLISVEIRYFTPVYGVFAALSFLTVCFFTEKLNLKNDGFVKKLFISATAVVMVWCGFILFKVSAHPFLKGTLHNKAALEREIKKHPNDRWLLAEYAKHNYYGADYKKAFSALDKYVKLTGVYPYEYVIAHWAAGNYKEALEILNKNPVVENEHYPPYMLETLIFLETGHIDKAIESFKKLKTEFYRSWSMIRYSDNKHEKEIQKKLRRQNSRMLKLIFRAIEPIPPHRQRIIKDRLHLLGLDINKPVTTEF